MSFADHLARADAAARLHVGGPVTYTPGVGAPVSVRGIFDAAYQLVDLQQAGVASTAPAVFLTLSELPSDPLTDKQARVTINGVTYTWHHNRCQPDGQGGVVLFLHKV
jgi:hypothetical protein